MTTDPSPIYGTEPAQFPLPYSWKLDGDDEPGFDGEDEPKFDGDDEPGFDGDKPVATDTPAKPPAQ